MAGRPLPMQTSKYRPFSYRSQNMLQRSRPRVGLTDFFTYRINRETADEHLPSDIQFEGSQQPQASSGRISPMFVLAAVAAIAIIINLRRS